MKRTLLVILSLFAFASGAKAVSTLSLVGDDSLFLGTGQAGLNDFNSDLMILHTPLAPRFTTFAFFGAPGPNGPLLWSITFEAPTGDPFTAGDNYSDVGRASLSNPGAGLNMSGLGLYGLISPRTTSGSSIEIIDWRPIENIYAVDFVHRTGDGGSTAGQLRVNYPPANVPEAGGFICLLIGAVSIAGLRKLMPTTPAFNN